MADRYWVGGSDNWDGIAGTKWSTTSGGAGGSAVPTTSDDVYFDANSGAVTVTVSANGRVCKNLTFTGFTGTFTGSSTISNITGNIVLDAGMTWTHTGTIIMQSSSSATITSNGKAIDNAFIINKASGSVTLSDDFNIQSATAVRAFILTAGTFNANNKNVRCGRFGSNNSNTRTITMGDGIWELCADIGIWNTVTQTGLTFNPDMATVECSYSGANARNFTAAAGVVSFYRITRTVASAGAGAFNFQGVVCPRVNLPSTGAQHSWQITAASDVTLESDMVLASADGAAGALVVTDSVFDSGNFDMTATIMLSTAAGTREIHLGSSVVNLFGNQATPLKRCVAFQNAAGLTFDAGTSTINFVGVSGVDTEIQGAGKTFYNVVHNGTATPLRLTDANTYNDIQLKAGETLQLTDSLTHTLASITVPDDVDNGISIVSTTPATQATISIPSGYYNLKGVAFQDVEATGGAIYRAFVSNGNIDGGNNSGIDFGKGLAFCLMI